MATPETPLPFFFIYELSLSSNETQKKNMFKDKETSMWENRFDTDDSI